MIEVEGATLQTIHTPGHTCDHCCFYLNEENSLFTGNIYMTAMQMINTCLGDCILGGSSALFESLSAYIRSLQKLEQLSTQHNGLTFLYPGHGKEIPNPIETIQGYITHRLQREGQIIASMEEKMKEDRESNTAEDNAGWLTSWQITKRVYTDLPSSFHLYPAQKNVNHHLEKLLDDLRVEKYSSLTGDYWRVV